MNFVPMSKFFSGKEKRKKAAQCPFLLFLGQHLRKSLMLGLKMG